MSATAAFRGIFLPESISHHSEASRPQDGSGANGAEIVGDEVGPKHANDSVDGEAQPDPRWRPPLKLKV